MNKKLIAIMTLVCMCLTGCAEYTPTQTQTVKSVQMEYSQFDLVADEVTGIIYIDNWVYSFGRIFKGEYHIYTPYYSKNGKLCKFYDGKIVEVEDED